MTLEEKITLFKQSAMSNATSQSASIIGDYEKQIQSQYKEYTRTAIAKEENELKIKTSELIKNKNQALSKESLEIKRTLNKKTDEIKIKIFDEVTAKLLEYKKTPEYTSLLTKLIHNAISFASGMELTIYIDSSDEKLKSLLEKQTGCKLITNDESFIGGIKAMIPAKNVLIDESFASKLAHEKDNFNL